MTKQWIFKLKKFANKLSVRAAFFTVLAVVASLCAVYLSPLVSDDMAHLFGDTSVDRLLTIMASSMLMVLTFSLSTMLTAYSSANQVAPPRATILIIEDSNSFSAISIILGGFIFSIVSLIALSYTYYGTKGRVILMMMTILVLISIVSVIIRWIEQLKNLGKVQESIRRIEHATVTAIISRSSIPDFGCRNYEELESGLIPVFHGDVGYVQNIDIETLSQIAKQEKVEVFVNCDAGKFVHKKIPIVYLNVSPSDEFVQKLILCFSVSTNRTFTNDPRYGLTVLSSIGSKALSPSLNDPGTAVDVISSLVRVLTMWETKPQSETESCIYKNVYFKKLKIKDLFYDAFFTLAKDGASQPTVVSALTEAFEALGSYDENEFRSSAYEHLVVLKNRIENGEPLH